jgi:hypothetical protein
VAGAEWINPFSRDRRPGGECSAVQCSTVQCSAVQCSAVQCSAVHCSAVQCRPGGEKVKLRTAEGERKFGRSDCQTLSVQCSAVQCSAVQCSVVRLSDMDFLDRIMFSSPKLPKLY